MTVKDLIAALQGMPQDAVVGLDPDHRGLVLVRVTFAPPAMTGTETTLIPIERGELSVVVIA